MLVLATMAGVLSMTVLTSGAPAGAQGNPPVVTGLSSSSGPPGGGQLLLVYGRHFAAGFQRPQVKFGTAGAFVIVWWDTWILVFVPNVPTEGSVDVTVKTANGTSQTSSADVYTFGFPPTVTSVSPSSGSPGGGNTVTVNGTNLVSVQSVDFGAAAGSQVVANPNGNSLTVTAPPGTPLSTVDVTVATPLGTSPTGSADQYTYQAVPAVTGVSPAIGLTGGGTSVTLSGSGFTGATQVDFGGVAGTSVNVVSDSSITVNSPSGSGLVNVTVAAPGGTSSTGPANQYLYENAPVVTSVSPTSGAATGGGLVTVTGSGFLGAGAVDFGGNAASNVTIVNGTKITAEPPAGSGTVDVTVTTPLGTSPASSGDQYTYLSGSAADWGDNTYGELGNGTTNDGTTPAAVAGLPTVAQMAGGGASTLALTTGGNVYAWGGNFSGELGDGTLNQAMTPTEVEGPGGTGFLSGVVQIAAGAASSYALTSGGNVYAWGDNTPGELGVGNNTNQETPTLVVGPAGTGSLSNIVAIAAHGDWAMALSAAGNVYAWGDNADGQLGDNSTSNSNAPVEVQAVGGGGSLTGIVQIAEGADTGYGLTGSGQVDAWGVNTNGELGNGSIAGMSPVPVTVSGLTGIVQVTGGLFHALAVTSAGQVWGWGDNSQGELGMTPSTIPVRTPVLVPGIGNVSQVAAGYDYSMAISAGGSLYTWGYNADGELGDGSLNPPATPAPALVSGLPPVVGIAGGWTQSTAVFG